MFCDHVLNFFEINLGSYDTNYLEIGVYKGESISTLARKYPNKKILGVDPFIEDGFTSHDSKRSVGEHLSDQENSTLGLIKDCANIVLFKMASKEFNSMLTAEMINEFNVGFVFIDGDHHYDHVTNDFDLSMKLIGKKPGLIAVDDVNVPDVKQALEEFKAKEDSRIKSVIDLGRNSIVLELKAE